ncbi:MAG: hypothetical protein SYC29_05940 [Planctomycetota bacterium]|nr:hypothetical protein [Planctomycetota bacterium]
MALKTRLQPKYWIRMVIIALVSIVLGVWGVWDYFYAIPGKETAFHRGQICLAVKDALQAAGEDPATPETREEIDAASAMVEAELQDLWDRGLEAAELDEPAETEPEQASMDEVIEAKKQRFEQVIAQIRKQNEEGWLGLMVLFQSALAEAELMQPGRRASSNFAAAYELARLGVDETGNISQPAVYDRYVKGLLFIPCIPFGLYLFWPLYRRSKQVYGLEEDGTFFAPEGRWPNEEIADIDMSRWMSKSIAHVELKDGTRVKLDDYIFRNVHLIVGALASERYPEQWDREAKPIKKGEAEDEDAEDGAEDEAPEDAGPEADADADEQRAEAAS